MNKMPRSLLLRSSRGGRSQARFRNAFLNVACERPPRLRGIRWLRDFLLTAQPPLLKRRGNSFSPCGFSYSEGSPSHPAQTLTTLAEPSGLPPLCRAGEAEHWAEAVAMFPDHPSTKRAV